MVTIVCILYFIILTYIGFNLLYKPATRFRVPFTKHEYMLCNGPEALLIFIFWTGLIGLGPVLSLRLGVLEILCYLGIYKARSRVVWSVPLQIYVLFLIWVVIGCFYTPSPVFGGRMVLKYLYPFLVALFASTVVRDREVAFKAIIGDRITALVVWLSYFVPGMMFLVRGVFWHAAALTTHFITVSMFSLSCCYLLQQRFRNILWCIVFSLPCFLWSFRTGILGLTAAFAAFFFVKYRLKSVPIIAAIGFLAVCSIFYIPRIKQKMYFNPDKVTLTDFLTGNVEESNINTSGRNLMWDMVMPFYEDNKLIGAGTGRVQKFFYTEIVGFGRGGQLHSDFLLMLCDNGLIGFFLYVLSYLGALFHCTTIYRRTNDRYTKALSITAGAALCGVLVTLYSDNSVSYSMCTLSYPWGLYGMVLGLYKREKEQS